METKIIKTAPAVGISPKTDVAERCRAADELSIQGEYEAAREALGDLWPGIGRPPRIEALAPADQAEVLLRIGALSGWLGSSGQVAGARTTRKIS